MARVVAGTYFNSGGIKLPTHNFDRAICPRRHRAVLFGRCRKALAQVDGASLFDADGTLRAIGVRLIPSTDSEMTIDAFRGTRHTSARRYSADDPGATVIVVSEDGPVTVMRTTCLYSSRTPASQPSN